MGASEHVAGADRQLLGAEQPSGADRESSAGALLGIFGHPYIDLEPHLDLAGLADLHDEICMGLTQVAVDYTGGSHRTLGIVPPSLPDASFADYGEVLRSLSPAELGRFASLSDRPPLEAPLSSQPSSRAQLSGESCAELRDPGLAYGEERDIPLSRRQMLWLKYRHGVYFPWKVYFEFIPNRYWSDKSRSEGKDFTRLARAVFPKTIAFVKSLPFSSIGRCNLMGLEANDHGTVHRDGERTDSEPDHFITICPAGNKTLFLWDERAQRKVPVRGRAYWFNDNDYHGVEAAPFFRYSLRIDGTFEPSFLARLRARHSEALGVPA